MDRHANDLGARIDEWSEKLERLKDRLRERSPEERFRHEPRMGELEEKRQSARSRVDALGAAADSTGEDLRSGAEAAVDELGTAVRRARDELDGDLDGSRTDTSS
jgi:chromosome segregation ATPase